MGWPTSRGLVSDWSQINIQHSAVDSGCRFDRPFQRIGPQIVIYLLMVLGLGTPASAHRVDTFAIDGNLVPAPGVIRDADRAPIPSKGKQRFGALFSVERSIELTTAVASRELNVCDPRPRRLGFYDHATVKSPWHDLSTLRCRWRWIV